MAAAAAADLARQADRARDPQTAEGLLELAVGADPLSTDALGQLGILRLRNPLGTGYRSADPSADLGNEIKQAFLRWKALSLKELVRARAQIGAAQAHLLVALAHREDDQVRAAALVAAVLERQVGLALGGGERRAWGVSADEVVRSIARGGAPAEAGSRLLTLARRLEPREVRDLDGVLEGLQVLRPDWVDALAGIKALAR